MLMITTTVGMFDGVHTHSSYDGPSVPLGFVLEVSTSSLEDGFVNTTTSSDDADHGAVCRGEDFLRAGWQLYSDN